MTIAIPLAIQRLKDRYWNERSVSESNPGGFGADGHKANLPALAEAMGVVGEAMLQAGLFQVASSTTEATIGTGAKSLTVQADKGFAAGMLVIAYETGTPGNSMTAPVSSYVAATGVLQFTVPTGWTRGSGTISAWTVVLAGAPGVQGPTGGIAGGTLEGDIDADGHGLLGGGTVSANTIAAGTALTLGGTALTSIIDDAADDAVAVAVALSL